MKILKISILIFLFSILSLELFNTRFHLFSTKPLVGAFTQEPRPDLSLSNWFTGNFQFSYNKFFEQQLTFRPDLVRIRNQIDFSFFNKVDGGNIVVGKDNMFFQDGYGISYIGHDLRDQKLIIEKLTKIKFAQEELKKKNIDLVFLISPGKPYYYPDYLPDNFVLTKKVVTNYDMYCNGLNSLNINHIDFNGWFKNARDTSKYPLFAQFGTHWSCYGASLAGDSLIRYLEKLSGLNLCDYKFSKGELTTQPKETDNDLYALANLIFKVKQFPVYYPKLTFNELPDSIKPGVLIVGTSFVWNWMGMYPFFQKAFNSKSYFWYYNKEVYNGMYHLADIKSTDQLNYKDEIFSRRFILIEANISSMKDFNSGFIDQLYDVVKVESLK